MYRSIRERAEACLAQLEAHGADPGTLSLHDPVFAILQAADAGDLVAVATEARVLAGAVEKEHPASGTCRLLLGELSELGLWSPRQADSEVEAALRGIGLDPDDPAAGKQLQGWLERQERQRVFLEEKTDELRVQLRRTERFSSTAVGIAVLLGLLLLVSLLFGGLDLSNAGIEAAETVEEVGR
ncbi:MAG: hypothetical protein VXW32_11445 [Myxococcota bacterium]|nr:hypothetical protein [Myxococcota bacterium]